MSRILVVDDEEDVLALLRVNLMFEGFEVIEASGGREALGLAAHHQPDCVLLDWMMPGLDGLDVCRAIRGDPVTRGIAVVIFSAKARPEDAARAVEAGADDFVVRPSSLHLIGDCIRGVLAAKVGT